jgi:hypothetical protein
MRYSVGDGSVTIDRIIDRIVCTEKNRPVLGRTSDLSVLKVPYAVCFKSAEPIVGLNAELRCTRPFGDKFIVGTKTLDMAGEYKGTFLCGELDSLAQEDGWHLFDVVVTGIVKTQMALHVSVQRQAKTINHQIQRTFAHPKCYARLLGNCS